MASAVVSLTCTQENGATILNGNLIQSLHSIKKDGLSLAHTIFSSQSLEA
jgi:hypothetical protein